MDAADLSIVSETDELVAIDKPAGIVSAPVSGKVSLLEVVRQQYPEALLVHRLDKETSGVIIFARSEMSQSVLRAQFKDREVNKTYFALVDGVIEEGVIIDLPLKRDPASRTKFTVFKSGKPAVTEIEILGSVQGVTLVKAMPRTGRTHQIRVHLAALGHPIIGDKVYGKPSGIIGRLALHSYSLHINAGGKRAEFVAPLPADIRTALSSIGISHEGLL